MSGVAEYVDDNGGTWQLDEAEAKRLGYKAVKAEAVENKVVKAEAVTDKAVRSDAKVMGAPTTRRK